MAPTSWSDQRLVEAAAAGPFDADEPGWCIVRRLYRRLAARRSTGARPRCRVVLALDIASFTSRDEATQIHLRESMYRIVHAAYAAARIGRRGSTLEDRGDGVLMVVRAKDGLDAVIPVLIQSIRRGVRAHNAAAVPAERMQLRVALHAGFLHRDAYGVTGNTVNRLFRMLDAPVMKERLAVGETDFALILSEYVYETATGYRLIDGKDFEMIRVDVKETHTIAWLWMAPSGERLGR
jgi:hypothetical protein